MSKKPGVEGEAARLLALAAEAEPHLKGPDSAAWMDRLERDHEGFRRTFSRFLEQGRAEDALRLAADLWMFHQERGHPAEGRAWLGKALAAPGAEAGTATRARALHGAGTIAFRQLDEADAERSFKECLAISRKIDDVGMIVGATGGLARIALRRGDTADVRKWSEEGLAVARSRGGKEDAIGPLHMLAAAARIEGDLTKAKGFYRQTLELNRELERPKSVSVELENLGALEVMEGNLRDALPLLRESLRMAHERGDKYLLPYDLAWLGRVALAKGELERAATLFGAAKVQFDASGLAMDPDEAPEYEKGLAAIREAMDRKAFNKAWANGQKMSLDEAVALALGRE